MQISNLMLQTQWLKKCIFFSLFFALPAFALEGIVRPYQSVRSAGMGGVRMTTGLYDENFFNNPARVTANPESKFTIFQITPFELNPATISAGKALLSGQDALKTVTSSAGSNLHDRFQLILPAYYLASNETRKWSLAIGVITSFQANADLNQSYQTSFDGIADIGPAITYGRKFLRNDDLSVGLTTHLIYRVGAKPAYSLIDYVSGKSLGLSSVGGEGAMVDFDLGSTYQLTTLGEFHIAVGAALQNILGGNYTNLGVRLFKNNNPPPNQPRSLGFGISGSRPKWAFLSETIFAFEVTDIGNNSGGSLFRLLHLGGETHWKKLAVRLGLNQGYLAAGLGFDIHYFSIDLATYGEELGLNAGTLEDRRYTLNFGFHI